MINGHTQLFGVLGTHVQHSLSPIMHNAGYQVRGINAVYVPLRASAVQDAFAGLKALGFTGVSVTVPHKETIMPMLDVIDPVAKKIGAVNTLVFSRKEERTVCCLGTNTDWIGANQALAEVATLAGSKVLVLGAGGAARAIGFGLQEAQAEVYLANRSEDKGRKLAAELGCNFVSLQDLPALRADILVNATAVGMTPEANKTPIDASFLRHFSVVMDIVYAPLKTRLLQEAEAQGCVTVSGVNMLLYQAMEQWRLWFGEEAPKAAMREALAQSFEQKP